ncbi:cation-transporting P-type ATPase, partial [Candidatus Gottesmanbacteria bacterium]|nr:cation-transporting P-type ATPase [Candidatus Gottesmanbacteria bacterium]
LVRKIDNLVLFARVTPSQKFKIVEALKEKGEVVAILGDGVNDALALKRADIGVVVGEASEVAKENADLILLD